MAALLYFWILFFSLLAGGGAYGLFRLGQKLLQPIAEKRRLIAQGQRNYRAIVGSNSTSPLCTFCTRSVNPGTDLYTEGLGWVHKSCYHDITHEGVDHEVSAPAVPAASLTGRVRNPR